ncbi:hypothetical protein GJ688_17220 [Heliobacillus mobilis]|uniref:Uncharacterized protein n=1 Tax=Heliobacterium mobile TaxID=28064 RepID=A0A6I3SP57_HELMO|nr:hypothetical protein [Heliobacterium mobile]MTV50679.1 hypothetical protein [Heliobacterium mobile]
MSNANCLYKKEDGKKTSTRIRSRKQQCDQNGGCSLSINNEELRNIEGNDTKLDSTNGKITNLVH